MQPNYLFVLFVFLILLSSFFSLSNAGSITTPWEHDYWTESNSNILFIFGLECWINISKMDNSLTQLDLNYLHSVSGDDSFLNVLNNYNYAELYKDKCNENINSVINPPPNIYIIEPTFYTIFLLLKVNDIYEDCAVNYPFYWRNTMTLSIDILNKQYSNFKDKCDSINNNYLLINDSGLCDYYPQDCKSLKSISKNCNGNYYYGDYSNLSNIKVYFSEISEAVKTDAPNMSTYPKITSLTSSNTIEEMDSVLTVTQNNLKNREDECNLLLKDTVEKGDGVETHLDSLNNENLYKIKSGSKIGKYLGGGISSISSDFDSFLEQENNINSNVDKISYLVSHKENNFLYYCFNNLTEDKNNYLDLTDELNLFDKTILDVVESKKDEAEQNLDNFDKEYSSKILTTEAINFISGAKSEFEAGHISNKYGDKYYHFRECVKNVNLAKMSMKEYDGNDELLFYSELSDLKNLIKNAKKDDLNVDYEEQLLVYLDKYGKPEFVGIIDKTKQGIIEKARAKYSSLPSTKKEIDDLISISDEDFGYYSSFLKDKEEGVFTSKINLDGTFEINYLTGIGKLKELKENYNDVYEEIMFKIKDVVPKKMNINNEFEVSSCSLSGLCNIRESVEVYNPYNIKLNGTKISINLPNGIDVKFYKHNIIYGYEFISDLTLFEGELNLYFNNILPEKKYYIQLFGNGTVFTVTKSDISSKGNPDGSAELNYDYSINSKYKVNGIYLNDGDIFGEINNLKLNGISAEWNSNNLNVVVPKGHSTLNIQSFLSDAFDIIKNQTTSTSVGTTIKVEYELNILPKIELDKVSIVLDDGYNSNVRSLSVLSYSGATIKNKKSGANGKYSFDVVGLKTGDRAKLKVSYIVDDSLQYVSDELVKIDKDSLDENGLSVLSEVNLSLIANDSKTAIVKLKELEHIIDKDKQSKSKIKDENTKLKEELNSEMENINNLLDKNSTEGLNDDFITKLKVRKTELENVLDDNSGVSEENNSILNQVDKKWMNREGKKFSKRMYERYNKIKDELISLNVDKNVSKNLTEIENNLIKFDMDKKLGSVDEIIKSLDSLQEYIDNLNLGENQKNSLMKNNLIGLKEDILQNLSSYKQEYDYSKNINSKNFIGLFKFNPSQINSELSKLTTKSIDKFSNKNIKYKISTFEKYKNGINGVLSYLKGESERRISELKTLFSSMDLSDEDKVKFEKSLSKLEEMNKEGKYIAVMNGAELLLNKHNTQDQNIFGDYIWLISLIIISAISLIVLLYLMRDKLKPTIYSNLSKLFKFDFNKKKQKKRLRRFSPIEEDDPN